MDVMGIHCILLEGILILLLCVLGCQSGGIHGEILNASHRIERALSVSYKDICGQPVKLKTRINACQCDENLQFEANLYGQWRYVRLLGTADELAWIYEQAKNGGSDKSFEVWYILTPELYVSKGGQEYYMLLPVAGE